MVDPSELRRLPLFTGISDAACRELAPRSVRRAYETGATPFTAGTEAHGRDAIASAMHADPELAWRFLSRLAARVRMLVERVDGLAARSVPQRLAAVLAARHEGLAGARNSITLGSTQREVAEELGTVREVVVRAVRALCDAGAIEPLGRGRYRVRDVDRLKEIAG